MTWAIVCGGRRYNDRERLFVVMDELRAVHRITRIIHGAATGADTLSAEWARSRGVEEVAYPADWSQGNGAGPTRNTQMLESSMPDIVVAFPGGRGTVDMIRKAESALIPVIRVS